MSDFDKEAEREKLREKYEAEEERRETTEQMSELLLKGATMTNAHCGDCGDPIFRYDGQEFCPTCQKPVDRGTDEAGADGEETTESGERSAQNGTGASENIEVTKPSDDASVRFGGDDVNAESQPSAEQPRTPSREQSPSQETPARDRGTDDGANVQQVPSAAPSAGSTADRDRPQPDETGSDATGPVRDGSADAPSSESVGQHLESAQVVLAQTVERHARLAAAADSPRETRDHLATAREAAETLDATGY